MSIRQNMRNVTVSALFAFVLPAFTDEVNHTGSLQDLLDTATHEHVDNSVNSLSGRAIKVSYLPFTELDRAMLLKPAVAPSKKKMLPAKQSNPIKGGDLLSKIGEAARLNDLKRDFGISGQTIGKGKYFLCENPQRSDSGRSSIYRAYRMGPLKTPEKPELVIKVSSNSQVISEENRNYDIITSGMFPGRFVKKIDFLRDASPQPASKDLDKSSALVLEAGQHDLLNIVQLHGGRLKGIPLRDTAIAAAECIQAVHSSGMVWGDLKPENFVVIGKEVGPGSPLPGVKGIDVESILPHRSHPIHYTIDAAPPEFARFHVVGKSNAFVLDYSYDIWSYGMFLYNLAAGRRFFSKGTEQEITEQLARDDLKIDLKDIKDDMLRDLIKQCLRKEPTQRPNIMQVIVHPYFMISRIDPFRVLR